MRVALCGNISQDDRREELRQLLGVLHGIGCNVSVERSFHDYLLRLGVSTGVCVTVDVLPQYCDVVLSVGGDGTFLRTAAWIGGASVPVMGVNTGHLGYLAAYSMSDMEELRRGLIGDRELSPRIMLETECEGMPDGFYPFALNEVAVSKGDTTSMVNVRAYVNGHYLADYLADGLLVATPTGSTAYNLSCGGPILEPTMQSMVLCPIAPHSLTLRPLVISADSELRLDVSSRGAAECHIGVDGRTFAVPASGATLRVRRSCNIVNVVQPVGSFFAKVLRHKLRWGER